MASDLELCKDRLKRGKRLQVSVCLLPYLCSCSTSPSPPLDLALGIALVGAYTTKAIITSTSLSFPHEKCWTHSDSDPL